MLTQCTVIALPDEQLIVYYVPNMQIFHKKQKAGLLYISVCRTDKDSSSVDYYIQRIQCTEYNVLDSISLLHSFCTCFTSFIKLFIQ